MTFPEARASFLLEARFPLVRFSDAHRPEDIGRASTAFRLAAPRLAEIRKALRNADGRRVCEP
jgi:PHP family Zn ribbon phosphoesterase